MENLVTKVQKLVVVALAVLLLVVVVLSTAHLGVLVAEEIWKPPRFLIPVEAFSISSAFSCWSLSASSYWIR